MNIRGIDLFCGGGGSSWGAMQAGVTMVGAVDAWDVAADTYKANFTKAKVVTAKLTDESGPEIFGHIGKINLLIASPECTHHSIARGSKPRCDESRRSGWYIMRFIREMKPRWIVIENVTAMRNWEGFDELKDALEEEYNLNIQHLDSADFGVPQSRRRLFIMGDRFRQPSPIQPTVTERVAAHTILDPEGTWNTSHAFREGRAPNTAERIRKGIEELGPGKDFLIVYYSQDRGGGWQPLDRPLRTLTTVDRFGLVTWRDGEPRLRMLQLPELKRAMGFHPDVRTGREFVFGGGTRRDHVKIFGNGVCPPVMEEVISSLTGAAKARAAA
ncbi:MAG: DNA cytosine methyltransferase [Burkholderiales bacterium]|nr:DNA cytosine methyltransferase [Burkholderiales bacterium]